MSQSLIGERVGSYRVTALIGRGGMGTVYRAVDERSGREVAVKVLDAEQGLVPSALERFEQEVASLEEIDHPNIVRELTGVQRQGERFFFAMELIDGRSLDQVLGDWGRLPVPESVAIVWEVLNALEAAHTRGVIHRDMKPGNVILARGGEIKVVDFGLARAFDTTRLTSSGLTLGTPAYMSPEQADAKTVDRRSDVYSVGVMFFEMVSGRRPFGADTPLAVLKQHVESPVPPIEVALPSGLEALIRKAMAKEPGGRFLSAGEMAWALRDLGLPRVARDRLADLVGSTRDGSTAAVDRYAARQGALRDSLPGSPTPPAESGSPVSPMPHAGSGSRRSRTPAVDAALPVAPAGSARLDPARHTPPPAEPAPAEALCPESDLDEEYVQWLRAAAVVLTICTKLFFWAILVCLSPKAIPAAEVQPLIMIPGEPLADGRVITWARFEMGYVLVALIGVVAGFVTCALLTRHWKLKGLIRHWPERKLRYSSYVLAIGLVASAVYFGRLYLESLGHAWPRKYVPVVGGFMELVAILVFWMGVIHARRIGRSLAKEPKLWIGIALAILPPAAELVRYIENWEP